MLNKIFGKKDSFFAEMPAEKGAESIPAMAPTLREETEPTPDATGAEAKAKPEPADAATAEPSPAAAPKANTIVESSDLIAAAVQAHSAAQIEAEAEAANGVIFAETQLLNPGNRSSRRRPGASMAAFMNMMKS